MKVFFDDDCLLHNPPHEFLSGKPVPYFEAPIRVLNIREALAQHPTLFQLTPTDPDTDINVREHILKVHTDDYLKYLESAYQEWIKDGGDRTAVFPETFPHMKFVPRSDGLRGSLGPLAKAGLYCFDLSCPITPDTFVSVLSSARVALSAANDVLCNRTPSFALTRPPGHHAGSALCGGYCYLNNAAIAARFLQQSSDSTKLAILDIDYHHGNGTQEIFYSDASVLYTSIHAYDDYPYFTGSEEETGSYPGVGCNFNVPLRKGTTDDEYLIALESVITKIKQFEPSYIVVSLGVDTYKEDPISDFRLTTGGYAKIGRMIGGLNTPTLFVMEGGYHLETIGENVSTLLRGVLSNFD